MPVVSAAIELQARDTLCALIDHGLGRTMDDVMEGIDAVIAPWHSPAIMRSNLRDFARAEVADWGVVKVFHTHLPRRARRGNTFCCPHIRKAGSAKATSQDPAQHPRRCYSFASSAPPTVF